jgi:hypothetical protein
MQDKCKKISLLKTMHKVLVKTNSHSILYTDIDFTNKEWSSLLPENMEPFKVKEAKRPCSIYSNGLFPKCKEHGKDNQIIKVQRFPNYIEYCKIISDEIVPISGQLYLTSKFYDRRAEGWTSKNIMKKVVNENDVMGYCINGDVYCAEDKDNVYKILYGLVYKSLIKKTESFNKLLSMLKDNIALNLIYSDEEFIKYFKDILLSSLDF